MNRTFRRLLVAGVPLVAVLATAVVASADRSSTKAAAVNIPAFSTAELSKEAGADYLTNMGNLAGTVHSTLTQITPANAANLKVAWHTELSTPNVSGAAFPSSGGSSAVPIAYKGVLFTEDSYDRVYATDAASGKTLWIYDPKMGPPRSATPAISVRGLAVGDGMVFLAQGDSVITAINADTGQKVWARGMAKQEEGFMFTAAPLYYNGMLLTGTSGGDRGASCIFFAMDAKTGKVLWHWNSIPTKPSHLGYNTWVEPKKRAWVGGGAIWTTPTVDPKAGLVYFGVGNPIPYVLGRPPGAEVPTESIVALNVKSGKLAWYYQMIHHDIWDWDQSQGLQLFDMTYQGKLRHAGITVQKSGYAFVLDRLTGKPILPIPEVKQPQSAKANTYATQPIPQGGAGQLIKHTVEAGPWAGITMPDGKPPFIASTTQYAPVDDTHYTVYVQPGLNQWQHNSYDTERGDYYLQISRSISITSAIPANEVLPALKFGFQAFGGRINGDKAGTPAANATTTRLVAFNPAKNKVSWATEYENNPTTPNTLGNFTGVVSTKSGVIFAGRLNGYLEAYDSSNGKLLWTSPKLVAGTRAAPVVFSVNGKETVGLLAAATTNVAGATGSGSELYAFQLP